MRKIFIGFVLMLAFLPISVDAADVYYVDASRPDDSGDGLSPETAWKTISKVNNPGFSFNPGDSILFKRGETWRERLTIPSSGNSTDPITFGVYGSGPKPIISGGDLVTGWEQSDTNIWKATLTSTPEMAFFDESGTITWGDQKGSIGALVDEYDWYYDSVGDLLYCYAATDPDSRYTSVEASLRSSCIDWGSGVDRSYITIENLELKFAKSDGVLIRSVSGASTGNIVDDCNIHHIGDNGASKAGDGIEFQGCSGNKAINNTVHECGRHGIFVIGYAAAADDNIIEYNTVYDHWYGAIDHIVDDGDPQSVDGTIIRYNYIYNSGSGDFPGIHAKGNSGVSVTNTEMYYNIIHDIDDEGIKIHTLVSGLKIYNNVIAVTTISTSAGIYVSSLGTVDIKNNIIYDPQKYAMNIVDSTNVTVDYNCLYQPGGFSAYVDGAARNWAYWQGTAGFDTNGINSDPKFVNYSNDDFHLQAGSPCIDNGTDVGLTQDFEGSPVPQGSAPDIGAYESEPPICEPNTYYVDATNGDDGNDGMCTNTAWKTISKVNSMSFNPGDNIYFERGQTWREQLTVPSSGNSTDPITFGAYGSGADPIVSGMRKVTGWDTAGNWADQGGNVWLLDLAVNPRRLVIDGTEYLESELVGGVDATHRWFYDSGNTDLYLYATENPATAYSTVYYAATDVQNIYINAKSYLTIQDLEIQGGEWAVYIKDASSNILIHDCTIGKYTWSQGIRIVGEKSGSYTQVTDVEIYDCTIDSAYNSSGLDYTNGVAGDGIILLDSVASCKIYNNIITDWTHSCVQITCTTANCQTEYNEIYGNIMDGTNSNYLRGFDITNGGTTGQTAYNKIYRNLISNMSVRNQMNGDHNEFYYNIIHTVTVGLEPTYPDGISLFGVNGVCHDNKIYNNVIYNVARDGIYIPDWGGEDIENNLIRNNIIMNWGSGRRGIQIEADVTVKGNTWQNNLLYKSGVDDVVSYRGTLRTIAEFNAENGSNGDVITNNIGGDPLFVNASNNDYTLQYNSPCIDNGTDVNLTQDFEGNLVPQGSAPDIGAYEYVSGEAIPGDLNNDGYVDIFDLGIVVGDFGKTSGFDPMADVVQNNEIDIFDMVFVASRFS